jgi:hypothetical protein
VSGEWTVRAKEKEYLMTRTTTAFAVFAVLSLGTLSAKAASGTPEERDACTPDVYRLCNAEIPDEKRIVECLKKNRKLLSPACHKVFFGKD